MSRIDWKHVGEDSLGTALGLVLGGGLLIGAAFVGIKILARLGVPVYSGLSGNEVRSVYSQLDQNCKILSRYCGQTGDCQWCRGIYTGCGPLLYYRWQQCANGQEYLDTYHLPYESWTSEPSWNPFAEHGKLVFPAPTQQKQGGY